MFLTLLAFPALKSTEFARQGLPIKPAVDIEGDAVVKNGRLYCLREDEFGYKTLAVYRMDWKR